MLPKVTEWVSESATLLKDSSIEHSDRFVIHEETLNSSDLTNKYKTKTITETWESISNSNVSLTDRLLATDVCVPISSLPEVVLAAKEDILRCPLKTFHHHVLPFCPKAWPDWSDSGARWRWQLPCIPHVWPIGCQGESKTKIIFICTMCMAHVNKVHIHSSSKLLDGKEIIVPIQERRHHHHCDSLDSIEKR